jgi:hypothetical protein
MEALVAEADTHLLASLALGHSCFVVDYASRNKKRGTSRALWYGCTFISFACETVWFGAPSQTPVLRGFNVLTDFTEKLARSAADDLIDPKGLAALGDFASAFAKQLDKQGLDALLGTNVYGMKIRSVTAFNRSSINTAFGVITPRTRSQEFESTN